MHANAHLHHLMALERARDLQRPEEKDRTAGACGAATANTTTAPQDRSMIGWAQLRQRLRLA